MAQNPASIYYSPSATGDATVLGSGLNPLNVYRQEMQRQAAQRQAAARLAQQQEQADARNIVSLDANGASPYQDELLKLQQDGYQEQVGYYQAARRGEITQNEAKARSLQVQSRVKQSADRTNELDKQRQAFVALGSDPRYDKKALLDESNNLFYRTGEDGQRALIPSHEFDVNEFGRRANNSQLFNKKAVLEGFIKNQADAENVRLTKAAPPGGYGSTHQASSNIFDVNADGRIAINSDGSYKIRDVNALLQRAQDDPFMRTILSDNAKKSQEQAGAGAMQNYAQLSPEQQIGLEELQPLASAERVDLATMLAPYGKTKTSDVQTYRAAPRPRAGAQKAEVVAPSGFEAPGIYPATVPETGRVGAVEFGLGNTQVNADLTTQRGTKLKDGFTHYGEGAAPKLQKKDGTRVDIEAKNFQPSDFEQEDGKGNFSHVTNNKTPLAGGFGAAYKLLVDPKTGKRKTLPEGRTPEEAIRNGEAEYATFFNFNAHKNENYTADLSKLTDELMLEKNSNDDPKYQSRARAEIVAKEALEKGRARKLVRYAPNATAVDNETKLPNGKGYYQQLEEQAKAENQRIRGTRSTAGSLYTPKSKSTPAPAKSGTAGLY